MEKELLDNLNSNTILDVLGAMNTAANLAEKYELQNSFVDKLYHSLVPLLSHTHFKIRSHAFTLILQLLEEYNNAISCPDVAIPSILLSLLAVNKTISESAIKCLKIILEITDSEVFWPDIEAVIIDGRSTEIRLKILDILPEFANKIPLSPIVKLLDDPKAQIRNAAKQVLDAADPALVRAAINCTRISYEAVKRLVDESRYDLTDPTLAATDVKQITIAERDSETLARKRAAMRRKAADERNSQKTDKKSQYSNSIVNGSPRSYAGISLRRKIMKEQNNSSVHSSKPYDYNDMNNDSSFSIIAKEKKSKKKSQIDNSQINSSQIRGTDSIIDQPNSASRSANSYSNIKTRRKNKLYYGNENENDIINNIDYDKDGQSKTEINNNYVMNDDDENDEFLRLERQAIEETENYYDSNNNQPLGKIIPPPRVSLPVKPRDLSSATWLERVSFLEKLKESLAMSIRFKESPSQILDCVLTTAVPPHKKVTFLIPPILSEIILHHPEVLRSHLSSIVEFALNTMVSKQWHAETQFQQFLSVLILESDPTYLIDQSLRIADKCTHPLPYETFILRAYEVRDDIVLPYNIVSHMLTRLLKKPSLLNSSNPTSSSSNLNPNENKNTASELFTLICVKEMKSVQRFGAGQTPEVKKKIIPFLRNAQLHTSSREEVLSHRVVDLSNVTDIRELKQIIDTEMAKASKCDIPKLVAAFINFPHDKCQKLFQPFILFIASLPQRIVNAYEEEFVKICVTHFQHPSLLSFLQNDFVESRVICGLSRCIWNCPSSILEGSDKYLPLLYTMFKESIGSTRYELVQIFLAIYQKTRVSVLDLPEVRQPYKKLIDDMMAQFRIIAPKE